MSVEVVDYAFTAINEQALARGGKHGAGRYVGPGSAGKHLSATEVIRIHAAGLGIWLNVEGMSGDAAKGRRLGIIHAQQAEDARKALGCPPVPLYFAVDFDVTAGQWPNVKSYLGGAASVIGPARVGVYGGINAVTWAARDRAAAWYFQTYAWSGGRWFAGNHLEQYHNGVPLAGGTVDLCRALQANYGQWAPPGTTPPEDDMTPEQAIDFEALIYRVEALTYDRPTVVGGPKVGETNALHAHLAEIDAQLVALKAAAYAGPSAADIAKAIIAQLSA